MAAMPSRQLLILSLVVVFALSVEAQPDPNICVPGPGDSKNHSLPTIPDQFKLTVFAYFEGKNYSLTSTEYYDFINNQESIWSKPHGDFFFIGEHRTYMDYNDTQYYIVTPNETAFGSFSCETKPITNSSFGGMGPNGHIRSAKDVFKFGEMYNETYEGQEYVRYKKVDKWSSCVYENFGNYSTNYKIDFYFEAGEEAAIPVRVVINGTSSSPRNPNHTFYHRYEFRDVDIGPQAQENFLPPVGVMCPGRVPGKSIPNPPDYFSLSWEIVTKSQKRISYGKEYYKYSDKLVAIEYVEYVGKYEFHLPTRVVNDYNTGVSYIVHYNGCNVTSISPYSFDAATKDNQLVSLKSPSDFFALHASDVQWIYEGRSTMRDVVLDVWQTYRTNWKPLEYMFRKDVYVNSTWLYSFLVDGWKVDGGIPPWHSGMLPFRLDIEYVVYSTKTDKQVVADSLIYNFYQASDMMFEDTLFDVSMCYNHFNESLHLALTLEGKDTFKKHIANNTWRFTNGAIQSISDAIDVSPTRIANFEVLNGYGDLSTIFFTLLDRPKVEGDAVNATDPGPVLGTARKQLDLLVNSKDGSKLTIEFIQHEKIMKVNAVTGSLREETQPWMKDKPIGVSAGTVVGVAIGTFIIGVVVALLCAFVVFKRKTREIPYGVQD